MLSKDPSGFFQKKNDSTAKKNTTPFDKDSIIQQPLANFLGSIKDGCKYSLQEMGDLISAVQELEGVDTKEDIQILREMANLRSKLEIESNSGSIKGDIGKLEESLSAKGKGTVLEPVFEYVSNFIRNIKGKTESEKGSEPGLNTKNLGIYSSRH